MMPEKDMRIYVNWKVARDGVLGFLLMALLVSFPGAFLTHLGWLILKLASDDGITAGQVVLGILSVMIFPIGIVHGYMIWFGYGIG